MNPQTDRNKATQSTQLTRGRSSRTWRRAVRMSRARWVAAIAALPLLQATGCFPDPIGALNFELQSFFNTTLIDAVSVIVQNLLRL
ncbi:MAG TPA: hypothetical protein P5081_10190 [Phycisphaerae bacterium]|nr:hypothetical protein [Phycisphaerae bacterium]HRW53248.1 hypothetical protein [Phycisphaerae bacterium]